MATATETVDAKRSTRTMLLAGGAIALSVAAIVIAVMIDRSKQPPPAPSIADLRVEELEEKVDELEAAIGKLNAIGSEPTPGPPPPDPTASDSPPKACDADGFVTEGKKQWGRSEWGAALRSFEQAYACKASSESARWAAMSACKAASATAAKRWYVLARDVHRPAILQTCLQKGIEL